MNTASSMSTALHTRPGSDPVFGSFGGPFRATLRGLRMHWFLYRGRHAKTRTTESVGEMSAHMLRDIGAPDEMIASTSLARPAYERHGIPFGLSIVLLSLALTGAPTPASAQTAAQSSPGGRAQSQAQVPTAAMAGVFAGEYVNGAPVYRFPAVVVIGSRKESTVAARQQPCRQTLAHGINTRA
jgi:hypothetical protein